MTTIKVTPRNKKEKLLIKTFFKAMNLEIEEVEDNEITNPVILERLARLRENRKENTIRIDPKNVWKSIM
ncbi:hypothetical protein [Epilithonimonas xixisoli]|uniref:Uncharacterized protein n=1 Tax=Epilithonimonas xixisoli TaxID=1476462 RepID=A0A4R8IFJ9_9FLAO|nr:hypothetical protein [Epilithonimonas xixisoli]TDX84578.1 hypothetical protein B0I22_2203 [Epilithonimonas xixisoli]